MRVLFGPQQDHLHIDPNTPGGYEWWYFDALSDDGKYALVVIFFLGTPMSPYYKAVVDALKAGKTPPLPTDWCGVFFSLHERVNRKWRERAYAYNVYRDGRFEDAINVNIGKSTLKGRFSHDGRRYTCTWELSIDEKGLWWGTTKAKLTFETVGKFVEHEPMGEDDGHTWVCVAPMCRVSGDVMLANGRTVRFLGDGYHDHNFGKLPWINLEGWNWGCIRSLAGDFVTMIYYQHRYRTEPDESLLVIYEGEGCWLMVKDVRIDTMSFYVDGNVCFSCWLMIESPHPQKWIIGSERTDQSIIGSERRNYTVGITGCLQSSPFYRRSFLEFEGIRSMDGSSVRTAWKGQGFAETCEPPQLCHPLWSRMMWTRMRRRKSPLPLPLPPPPEGEGKERGEDPAPSEGEGSD